MNYLKITGKIPAEGTATFIMKVVLPHYVPQDVKVRANISDLIFTGSCDVVHLERISNDKNVISISMSAPVYLID
jgi:hypothetical protein